MPVIPHQEPTSDSTLPIRRHKFPTPRLRLHLDELSHEGSSIFLSKTKGSEDLEGQVQNVLNLLYLPDDSRPNSRSVTVVLRSFEGVAYTTGTELDDEHKEIHFNLGYIQGIKSPRDPRQEILGVICHELVHTCQWNAEGTCPGGLIEGVADWVRLKAGLAATHWKQSAEGKWDQGYQGTGFFLEYLEQRYGAGTVRKINATLVSKYDEEKLFSHCCGGMKIDDLWKEYGDDLKKKKRDALEADGEAQPDGESSKEGNPAS